MFSLEAYTVISALFPRLLGFIFFIALFPFLFQIRGLLGKNGILPIQQFLHAYKLYFKNRCYYKVPTIFWISSSDQTILGVVLIGLIASLLLMAGIFPPLMLFLLYIIYLSIVSTGQEFLGFGWELFLLEITVNTFFLSVTEVPNIMIWISINLLLFRFHLQAGAVKLQSHDRNWRNLTACAYHYQTQPLPNTTAWFIHKMPLWFHKVSCLLMFVAELAIPFLIFMGETPRLIAFVWLVGLQLLIWATGNFSYLNYMTVALCTLLLNNKTLEHLFTLPELHPTSLGLDAFITVVGLILTVLQLLQLFHHFFPQRSLQKLFFAIMPFYIINRYGIFAVMTTKRYEIIIVGSDDGVTWKEYSFPYKPSEIERRPRRISPYQPRLDWQVWFLPFSNFSQEAWFHSLLGHILRGTPEVVALLRYNPFPEKPPKFVQALIYDYVFSTWEEKKETGAWWKRQLIGAYSPILRINK